MYHCPRFSPTSKGLVPSGLPSRYSSMISTPRKAFGEICSIPVKERWTFSKALILENMSPGRVFPNALSHPSKLICWKFLSLVEFKPCRVEGKIVQFSLKAVIWDLKFPANRDCNALLAGRWVKNSPIWRGHSVSGYVALTSKSYTLCKLLKMAVLPVRKHDRLMFSR